MQFNLSAHRARSFLVFLLVVILAAPLFFTGSFVSTASAQFPEVDQLSCRDVFGQGDVTVRFPVASAAKTAPGAFFGTPVTISNTYPYPLKDVAISAAVYAAGSAIPFDWFTGESDIDIEANQAVTASLQWKVPNNTPAGSYEIKVFLLQGDTVDALGTALSTGGMSDALNFTVAGDAVPGTEFDAANITVNGETVAVNTTNAIAVANDDLRISAGMRNGYQDRTQTVPVTLTVYNSAYPHMQNMLQTESGTVAIDAGGQATQAIDVTAAFGEYVVTGQTQSSDGSRSSFITFLENEDKTAFSKPAPAASLIAVNTVDGVPHVLACIKNRESTLLDTAERAPLYPVEYRMTVYPFTNRIIGDDVIATVTESAELGGGIDEVGFRTALPVYDGELIVKVETLVDGWPVDTQMIGYDCDSMRGCERPTEAVSVVTGSTDDPIDKQMYLYLLMLLLIIVVAIILFVRHATKVAVSGRESRDRKEERPESEDLLEGSDDDIK